MGYMGEPMDTMGEPWGSMGEPMGSMAACTGSMGEPMGAKGDPFGPHGGAHGSQSRPLWARWGSTWIPASPKEHHNMTSPAHVDPKRREVQTKPPPWRTVVHAVAHGARTVEHATVFLHGVSRHRF